MESFYGTDAKICVVAFRTDWTIKQIKEKEKGAEQKGRARNS